MHAYIFHKYTIISPKIGKMCDYCQNINLFHGWYVLMYDFFVCVKIRYFNPFTKENEEKWNIFTEKKKKEWKGGEEVLDWTSNCLDMIFESWFNNISAQKWTLNIHGRISSFYDCKRLIALFFLLIQCKSFSCKLCIKQVCKFIFIPHSLL